MPYDIWPPDVWPMLPPASAASRLTLPNVPMPMPRPQMPAPQGIAPQPQNGLLDQFMLDRYARMNGTSGMGGDQQSMKFRGLLGMLQGLGGGMGGGNQPMQLPMQLQGAPQQQQQFGGLLGMLQGNGPGNAFSDAYRFL